MIKILYKEIKSCYYCPYADQDHEIVMCLKTNRIDNILCTSYEEMLIEKEIPEWCPLPNKE